MKHMLMSVIVCLLATSCVVDAKSYGGGGGSRSFSSSRSYSSPSRSYSSPRPSMTTPAPKASPPPIINNRTIINKNYSSGPSGSANNGSGMNNMLLGGTIGYLIGSHGSNQQPTTVVQQAPTQPVIQQSPAQYPSYQYEPESSSHWFLWLLLLIGAGVVIWLMVKHTK